MASTDLDTAIPSLPQSRQKTDLRALFIESSAARLHKDIEGYYQQWPQCMQAVLTFRNIAFDAEACSLHQLTVTAQGKVLDYLMRYLIMMACSNTPHETRLPSSNVWFKSAVTAITRYSSPNLVDLAALPVQDTAGIAKPTAVDATSASDSVTNEIRSTISSMEVCIKDDVLKWKDIVDVNGVKTLLERNVMKPLEQPQKYKSLARECQCRFLEVAPGTIDSKWQGIQRTSTKSAFLQHWSSLKGSNVVVVDTTKSPESIDIAFLRRLSETIYLPPPGSAARCTLIKVTLAAMMPHRLSPIQIKDLAVGRTKDFTCDEIVLGIHAVGTELVNETEEPGFFRKAREPILPPGGMFERCSENASGAIRLSNRQLGSLNVRPHLMSYKMLNLQFGAEEPACTKEGLRKYEAFKAVYANRSGLKLPGL
ncbi:MAG: hypothetical protein Q9220_000118 [cf. Caloplaca sp. 1 TL-2023]